MKEINQALLTGERALFQQRETSIKNSVFEDGESPLKESRQIELEDTIFRWKYPLWYAKEITARHLSLLDTARSGIWYTHGIAISDSVIQAPKTFRRSSAITLKNVQLTNAEETMWACEDIQLEQVNVVGDYFAKNAKNIKAKHLTITGNYAFDGSENVELSQATLLSKDAFWNCKNVTVKDSTIVGEYLAWNSENITFINCTIESNQGLCYLKNLVLKNCKVIHSDLIFEYTTVQADVISTIDSIKNPISGEISAVDIGELIFNDPALDSKQTRIHLAKELIHDKV
ncbi:DUF3737 family protein [Streptococcus pantholopis]|uniref:Hydrogenase n=1 Tax=Streptococcus pantholopis TaxID=1811193 RepID=A0A172Q5T6_9STRE|nr:DUF3737 family protein [Streptococcus pantholopis]AND78841.1 hydrogenase [Streptococcus pantholopis]